MWVQSLLPGLPFTLTSSHWTFTTWSSSVSSAACEPLLGGAGSPSFPGPQGHLGPDALIQTEPRDGAPWSWGGALRPEGNDVSVAGYRLSAGPSGRQPGALGLFLRPGEVARGWHALLGGLADAAAVGSLDRAAQSSSARTSPAPLGRSRWEAQALPECAESGEGVGGHLCQVPSPQHPVLRAGAETPMACTPGPHVRGPHGPSRAPASAAFTRRAQGGAEETGTQLRFTRRVPGLRPPLGQTCQCPFFPGSKRGLQDLKQERKEGRPRSRASRVAWASY